MSEVGLNEEQYYKEIYEFVKIIDVDLKNIYKMQSADLIIASHTQPVRMSFGKKGLYATSRVNRFHCDFDEIVFDAETNNDKKFYERLDNGIYV